MVPNQFRPISLCNVLYKIISKTLTNRLQVIMDYLISPNQGAFLKCRLISDNILLSHEIFHHMRTHTSQKRWMTLKLDMSKAYDRVELDFLINTMVTMGFPPKWCSWIYTCISSSVFQLLISGSPRTPFYRTRGLRQGDTLSSYLFLFTLEGLFGMLYLAAYNGTLQGIKLRRRCPPISHLLFANDSLMFSQATIPTATNLRKRFDLFQHASGQQINYDKLEVFFCSQTPQEEQTHIASHLQISIFSCSGKYLGLPSTIGRKKKEPFSYINDSVANKLQGWKAHLLSQGGKEILIKTTTSAMTIYALSSFLLPLAISSSIDKKQQAFLWG